jgi:hypothetical protein
MNDNTEPSSNDAPLPRRYMKGELVEGVLSDVKHLVDKKGVPYIRTTLTWHDRNGTEHVGPAIAFGRSAIEHGHMLKEGPVLLYGAFEPTCFRIFKPGTRTAPRIVRQERNQK